MEKPIVLICGATSDLGEAIIMSLEADQSHSIVATGRDCKKLKALSARFGCIKQTHVVDLSLENEVKSLLKGYSAKNIKFAGIICLAGRHEMKPLRGYSKASMVDIFDSNFYSSAHVISNCGRVVAERGSIVLVSSAATSRGAGAVGGYVASKSAVEGLTRTAALEFAGKGVRVNCVSPGVFESQMTTSFFASIGEDVVNNIRLSHPLGVGTPADVAGPIKFLLSKDSAWITGQNILIDGGFTINA